MASEDKKVTLWLQFKEMVTEGVEKVRESFKNQLDAMKESSLFFAGAFAGVMAGLYESVKAFGDAQAAAEQTNKVLESTGHISGMTEKAVGDLATALQAKTGVDDDVIRAGENMILTFTNIGKEVFPQTTKTLMDMTAAMNNGDMSQSNLKNTAIQLGKALNDPADGYAKLQKVGVTFTDQQIEQMKAMQASGNLIGAQTIMLKELQTEFGGSSEKLGTLQGAFLMAKTTVRNFMEQIGEALTPAMMSLAHWITETTAKVGDFISAHKAIVVPVAAAVAILTGLLSVITGIVAMAPMIAAVFTVITGPVGIAVLAISALTGAFLYFSTSSSDLAQNVRAAWNSIGTAVKEYAGAVWDTIKNLGAVFSDFGGIMKAVLSGNIKDMVDHAAALMGHANNIGASFTRANATVEESFKNSLAAEKKHIADQEKLQKDKAKHDADEAKKAAAAHAAGKKADLEVDVNYETQKKMLEVAGLQVEQEIQKQRDAFEKMTAAEKIKLLEDTVGREKIIDTLHKMDELDRNKKHEEAKQALIDLYNAAFIETIHKRTEEQRKFEQDFRIETLLGDKITAEQRNSIARMRQDFLANLSVLMRSTNAEEFMVGKRASQAAAIIATYEGATKAFTSLAGIPYVGPILGAIAAAAAIAAGLINVREIENTPMPSAYSGGYVKNRGGAGMPVNVADGTDELMVPLDNKEAMDKLKSGLGNGGGQEIHTHVYIGGSKLDTVVTKLDERGRIMQKEGRR